MTRLDKEASCFVEGLSGLSGLSGFSALPVLGRLLVSVDCFLWVGVNECFGLADSLLLLLLHMSLVGFEVVRFIGLGLKLNALLIGVLHSFKGRRIKFDEAGVLGIEDFVEAGFLRFSDEGFENFGEFLPSL